MYYFDYIQTFLVPLPNFGEQGGVTALGTGGGSGTNGSIGLGLTHSTSHQLPDGPTVGSIFSLFGIGRK